MRITIAIFLSVITALIQSAQPKYDLLLKNGHVIDPKNSINEARDLAISKGLIAAVEKNIDPSTAAQVIDLKGLYVAPGLVDIHVLLPERPHEEFYLKKMRPGDIYTHIYRKFDPTLDENGKVRAYLFEAKKRGVVFDVGHGGGSFVWRYAIPSMKQGFAPDSISTDLQVGSMNSGMKDIVNVMSKFLNLGMPLQEIILKSTWNPAKEIRREKFGHLTVGAPADVAVFRLDRGDFGFVDTDKMLMKGSQRLACEMTLMGGNVMWDLNGRASKLWDKR